MQVATVGFQIESHVQNSLATHGRVQVATAASSAGRWTLELATHGRVQVATDGVLSGDIVACVLATHGRVQVATAKVGIRY